MAWRACRAPRGAVGPRSSPGCPCGGGEAAVLGALRYARASRPLRSLRGCPAPCCGPGPPPVAAGSRPSAALRARGPPPFGGSAPSLGLRLRRSPVARPRRAPRPARCGPALRRGPGSHGPPPRPPRGPRARPLRGLGQRLGLNAASPAARPGARSPGGPPSLGRAPLRRAFGAARLRRPPAGAGLRSSRARAPVARLRRAPFSRVSLRARGGWVPRAAARGGGPMGVVRARFCRLGRVRGLGGNGHKVRRM